MAEKAYPNNEARRLLLTSLQTIRSKVTKEWTVKKSVKANLLRLVKRLLRKIWLSTRKTGEGDGDGAATSRVTL
jgi:hypothetical protein